MQQQQQQRDQERRRRQTQAPNGLIAPRAKRKGSPCKRDGDTQCAKEIQIYSGPSLPEDVWCRIHSLMAMRDAAQVACVSRAFLRSWRCHPNLIFSNTSLGMNKKLCGNDEIARDFSSEVNRIINNHSGIGVKKLMIVFNDYTVKDSCYLDSWLQIAVTPGIEELSLSLSLDAEYNFQPSLFCNGSGESIRSLMLANSSFRPTAELRLLRSLTRLHLHAVCITGDELGLVFANSIALERLAVRYCYQIVCLKVPFMLQRLRFLQVIGCRSLQVLDIKAPNVYSIDYEGNHRVQLTLGETLQMKKLIMSFAGAVRYVRVELPSSMPNLKIATIYSLGEAANTPMLHSKYLHLRKLTIVLGAARSYDYFSLVYFIDACPSLETFVLNVANRNNEHVSILGDSSELRRMQEQQQHSLRTVKIEGFCSARSLFELTCHMVESVTSLKRLTLEAPQGSLRCSKPGDRSPKCSPLPISVLTEARRTLAAIGKYIEPKVPSTLKLHVVKPCIRCHTAGEL